MSGIAASPGVRIDITDLSRRQIIDLGDWREAVYWLYGAEETLLYVGRGSIESRFYQHKRKKPWWPQVTVKYAAWYSTHTEAKSAEALAISLGKPLHNRRAEPLPVPSSAAPDGWLHMVSADVADYQLDALARDVDSRGLHVGIKHYRDKRRLAAVMIPIAWHRLATTDLSNFRVAGYDDESLEFTQPVEVRCGRCGAARTFTYRDDGGADYTESLAVLVEWARGHQCKDENKEQGHGIHPS